ncbi:cation transporter [Alginatibacterium sediminis]|uniref:Cation transporter n=1 Tax=Alginatibacterium sediminis TaxID=2164068 RepID=A0A420EDD4_9ALTE|nr:CDF family Co(II)/Ni(II) efflux transporter DmeF [Alginatibacterium sediminis]RKF18683.1 cation transporter [Alginatibacterium sediminis]
MSHHHHAVFDISGRPHQHDFSHHTSQGEQRTLIVLVLTAITMVIEIIAGTWFGSMALLADGWHMGTHVAAFAITIFAYRYARKHVNNPKFSFGTGKVSSLGGFASAVALAVVALVMVIESISRFFEPQAIAFNQAILVAIIGLVVNLVSAWILKDEHHHGHEHVHSHHDHNLHAAYMHVLADALTSLLAIVALLAGKYAGLNWLDPVMGIVGALVISKWAWGLISLTSNHLLDQQCQTTEQSVRKALEGQDTEITDLHVWHLGEESLGVVISLRSIEPRPLIEYKQQLQNIPRLKHVSIEVYS